MLDEVQEALSSLTGPCSSWVSNLGLLATEIDVEILGGDGSLLAKPEESLLRARDHTPVVVISTDPFLSLLDLLSLT